MTEAQKKKKILDKEDSLDNKHVDNSQHRREEEEQKSIHFQTCEANGHHSLTWEPVCRLLA